VHTDLWLSSQAWYAASTASRTRVRSASGAPHWVPPTWPASLPPAPGCSLKRAQAARSARGRGFTSPELQTTVGELSPIVMGEFSLYCTEQYGDSTGWFQNLSHNMLTTDFHPFSYRHVYFTMKIGSSHPSLSSFLCSRAGQSLARSDTWALVSEGHQHLRHQGQEKASRDRAKK